MHILITHGSRAQTRVLHFNRWQLATGLLLLGVSLLTLLSGVTYHFVFVTAAREGWPVVSPIVKLVVRDEFAQRDRFLRENLDAMAKKVGEMQAKLLKLESMGDRVSGLAGVKPEEFKPLLRPAAQGASAPANARRGRAVHPGLGQRRAAVARQPQCPCRHARRTHRPDHRPVHADRVEVARRAAWRS